MKDGCAFTRSMVSSRYLTIKFTIESEVLDVVNGDDGSVRRDPGQSCGDRAASPVAFRSPARRIRRGWRTLPGLYPLWKELIQRLADCALADGLASAADVSRWTDPALCPAPKAAAEIKLALGTAASRTRIREILARAGKARFSRPSTRLYSGSHVSATSPQITMSVCSKHASVSIRICRPIAEALETTSTPSTAGSRGTYLTKCSIRSCLHTASMTEEIRSYLDSTIIAPHMHRALSCGH